MAGIIFPPAWVLHDCEYLLDLVAKQTLFVDMQDDYDFAWVRDDEFQPARLIEIDRALSTEALLTGNFLGLGDAVTLISETGTEVVAEMLVFQPTGHQLYEYISSGR
ncbi:hypothetical protein [Lentzea albida]|uniref:Uncharacterized protein n=1 Tax=Lentzea albida TaxID=65499 RepID=A0A1H9UC23_9PSEU|nr:hypothetical protein [Lentzea albida]SES06643.1 hypothetical protein SAMN04488000_115151 [Lentzea albida]